MTDADDELRIGCREFDYAALGIYVVMMILVQVGQRCLLRSHRCSMPLVHPADSHTHTSQSNHHLPCPPLSPFHHLLRTHHYLLTTSTSIPRS